MELANALHTLIADVDGVADVYPPRSLFDRARERASALRNTSTLKESSRPVSPVVVRLVGDSVSVDVRIRVNLSRPLPATAEDVAAAIEVQVLLARPRATAVDVDVQICAISPRS